ncbi:MAG: hypothetical protein IPG42_01450 [Betaproteobacteria bacterium]|nr:hypothetical protein [Betaproteobacteria bacterium]
MAAGDEGSSAPPPTPQRDRHPGAGHLIYLDLAPAWVGRPATASRQV